MTQFVSTFLKQEITIDELMTVHYFEYNSDFYFQMLTHDMKQLELQRLKSQAMKIPPKIRVFSFAMLMCFLLTYMAIIVYEILTSLGGMF